jgi:invasion protein IalB
MFLSRQTHKHRRSHPVLAAALILITGIATAAHAQARKEDKPSTLPGGASSLTETFENWTVSCVSAAGETQCLVSQTQTQSGNGQRVLEVRLNPVPQDDHISGTVNLPFGLEFARGVSFQFDDAQPQMPFAFKTCLPSGCIVPLQFDKPALATLRKASNLKLGAVSIDNQNIPFTVPLKGFDLAVDRAASLVKGG